MMRIPEELKETLSGENQDVAKIKINRLTNFYNVLH